MKRHLYTIALALTLAACIAVIGCASKVQPITQPQACTCILGHPELDWVKDHDLLTDPADCPVHGTETE